MAHYHGQVWNSAELARALAVNESTVRRYLDLMTGDSVFRHGSPVAGRVVTWANAHALLGMRDLENHPKVGASWEG